MVYLGILLAASVFCCLVGVIVFVHLSASPTSTASGKTIVAVDAHEVARESERLNQLRQQLRTINREIESLRRRLATATDKKDFAAQLAEKLRQLQSQAEELRRKLAALEAQRREIETRIAALKKIPDPEGPAAQDLSQELEAARKAQHRLRDRLDALRRQRSDRQKRFAVTALSGGSGRRHHRPATFVECTAQGVHIQPAGIRFTDEITPAEKLRFLQAVKTTNYAVFLIRPDGYESFLRYRELLLSANASGNASIAIGYEPVNIEWELIYPKEGE